MRSNTVAKRDLTRGAAQGRRMIANAQQPAQFIINSTIEYRNSPNPVQPCASSLAFKVGDLAVQANEVFYLVSSSKFAHLHLCYVVVERHGEWTCSSREEACAVQCIAKVEAVI